MICLFFLGPAWYCLLSQPLGEMAGLKGLSKPIWACKRLLEIKNSAHLLTPACDKCPSKNVDAALGAIFASSNIKQEVSIRGIVRRDEDLATVGLPSNGFPLLEAVSLLGNIDPTAAAVLIDLGAVYTGREIKVCAAVLYFAVNQVMG